MSSDSERLREALQAGVELVESSVAHVSHGGPTRAQAEAWLELGRAVLAQSAEQPPVWECTCRGRMNKCWQADDDCPIHGERREAAPPPAANDVPCPENERNATTAEESGIRSAGNLPPAAKLTAEQVRRAINLSLQPALAREVVSIEKLTELLNIILSGKDS